MVKRFIIVILFLAVIFGAIFAVKYQQFQQMQAELAKPQPPATVATTEVREESWRPLLRSVGGLTAINGIDVTTEVAGKISRIGFESGGTAEEGDVLVELDATVDLATLEGLKADRRLALVQLRRSEDLLGRKAISRSQHDEAQAKYDAADARVEEQQEKIAKKTIRAPFSGRVGLRHVDVGQYLSPGDRIVSLQAFTPIYADYSLPEKHLATLHEGQAVEVRVDAYPEEVFTGRISAIDPGIHAPTRSVQVRATLENRDGRLRPGMFAEVATLRDQAETVLTVPRTAISFSTYGSFMYAVVEAEDGTLKAERRQVSTGETRAGRVVVTDGVQPGEQVVRAGLVKLRDGQGITIDNSVELDDAEVTRE